MKKLLFSLFFLTALFIASNVNAQLKGIYYQAVAISEKNNQIAGRDINGLALHNKAIRVRFSVLKGGPEGNVLYQETHQTQTDPSGLFSLIIGDGQITGSGQFDKLYKIDWSTIDHFLKVEIDLNNQNQFKLMSVQQFMAVPYAFYAEKAKYIEGANDTSNTHELQTLSVKNDTLFLTNGGYVILPRANVGVQGATVVNDSLILTLSNGQTINVGNIAGPQGPAGPQGAPGQNGNNGVSVNNAVVNNDSLIITLSNGQQINAGYVKGEQGQNGLNGVDGIGINNSYIQNDSLFMVFSNGQTLNVGKVKGDQGLNGVNGLNGVSVSNANITNDSLFISLSNGTTINAGYVRGNTGANGQSAYELAVANGFVGSETDWLNSVQGQNGTNGTDGQSAYELAVANGFVGSETDWLNSIKGQDGINGVDGQSAYELAVANGFVGSETDWLNSIKGQDGINGVDGQSAYELAVANGFVGTETDWLNSLNGQDGTNGNNGTNGVDGKNTLIKTTAEAAGTNCANGGTKVEMGIDANSNGILDAGEVDVTLTRYVCNGNNGTNGTNGTNGSDGKNTLIKTTAESAGVNCASGGTKVEVGLDADNNGVLDASEVNASLTRYVCNGSSSVSNHGMNVLTSGSGNFNVPTGVTKLVVELYGAGGAGGVGAIACSGANPGRATGGGGGGSGGYLKTYIPVSSGQSISYSVGVGGNSNSQAGGNTTFGTFTAPGGQGGGSGSVIGVCSSCCGNGGAAGLGGNNGYPGGCDNYGAGSGGNGGNAFAQLSSGGTGGGTVAPYVNGNNGSNGGVASGGGGGSGTMKGCVSSTGGGTPGNGGQGGSGLIIISY
jgi:hypothetical protein